MESQVALPLPVRKEMLRPLTGIRALAALWVVAGHFGHVWLPLCPSLNFLDPLLGACSLGVDLFFGLSGFILAHNYLEQFESVSQKPYYRFLGMRLARLYPVHLFTLLVLVVGVWLGQMAHFQFNAPDRLHFHLFVQNLFLVHGWMWNFVPSWNGPAWSISAEWFAYLLFPFLSLAVMRVRSTKGAIAGVVLPLAVLFATSVTVFETAAHPLFRIACEFAAGVFLYRLYQDNWLAHLNWSRISIGIMVLVVALIYLIDGVDYSHKHYPLAPLVVLFVFALANARNGIATFMSLPVVVFLGEASYSFYMTHDLVRMVLKKLLPVEPMVDRNWAVRFSVMAMYAAAIAIAAIGTYLIVEVRGRRAVRKMLDHFIPPDRKTARAQQTPAAIVPAL